MDLAAVLTGTAIIVFNYGYSMAVELRTAHFEPQHMGWDNFSLPQILECMDSSTCDSLDENGHPIPIDAWTFKDKVMIKVEEPTCQVVAMRESDTGSKYLFFDMYYSYKYATPDSVMSGSVSGTKDNFDYYPSWPADCNLNAALRWPYAEPNFMYVFCDVEVHLYKEPSGWEYVVLYPNIHAVFGENSPGHVQAAFADDDVTRVYVLDDDDVMFVYSYSHASTNDPYDFVLITSFSMTTNAAENPFSAGVMSDLPHAPPGITALINADDVIWSFVQRKMYTYNRQAQTWTYEGRVECL